MQINSNKGFTLVELSIVIVIIGLLIAGVTAGRNIVQSAKLQSIVSETNKFMVAYNTFKLQYNAKPGDMSNAQTFWASATQGDGNGSIGNGNTSINSSEGFAFWQHLALASLIEGTYTGVIGSGVVIGKNVPKANYKTTATYYVYSSTLWSNYAAGNSIVLSGTTSSGYDDYQVLVNDAYNLDKKIDDGVPYLGRIIGYSDTDGACAAAGARLQDSPNKNNIAYKVDVPTSLCTLQFALPDYKFR